MLSLLKIDGAEDSTNHMLTELLILMMLVLGFELENTQLPNESLMLPNDPMPTTIETYLPTP